MDKERVVDARRQFFNRAAKVARENPGGAPIRINILVPDDVDAFKRDPSGFDPLVQQILSGIADEIDGDNEVLRRKFDWINDDEVEIVDGKVARKKKQ
ncbi:hypothetical protein CMO96_00010 [Candidatus Woesebacteria bacterium]|nr:hypothetical protein [Candidatus Woesebacteria bacterium]|tara:strand:+ start:60 stop:353 length:294 start_codon:yes stop_codon:yes gene_type:complete